MAASVLGGVGEKRGEAAVALLAGNGGAGRTALFPRGKRTARAERGWDSAKRWGGENEREKR